MHQSGRKIHTFRPTAATWPPPRHRILCLTTVSTRRRAAASRARPVQAGNRRTPLVCAAVRRGMAAVEGCGTCAAHVSVSAPRYPAAHARGEAVRQHDAGRPAARPGGAGGSRPRACRAVSAPRGAIIQDRPCTERRVHCSSLMHNQLVVAAVLAVARDFEPLHRAWILC